MASQTILISPHPDDIALSLGGLMARLRGEELLIVTCFSQSCTDQADTVALTALRSAEDDAYAAAVGAQLVRLGFGDTNVRSGLGVNPLRDEPEAELRLALSRKLAELASTSEAEATVFVPLAIGGHPDHQHCRAAATAVFPNARLVFYEDLPYAAFQGGPGPVEALLQAQSQYFQPTEVHLSSEEMEKKLAGLRCYKSQVHPTWVADVVSYAAALGANRGGSAERYWALREQRPPTASASGGGEMPILFIHYGDSHYLKYTLRAARLLNPDKRVILLGDERNAHHASTGIEHVNFADYAQGAEIELFDRIYQHIAGVNYGRQRWVRFVFSRWFFIYNYITAHGIERFWTFDSDTLILTELAAQEAKYADYDCTEQCSGICMNGFIGSRRVVKGYVDKINELFQRTSFLEAQRANLEVAPTFALTEMRAYIIYRKEERVRSVRLSRLVEGETFMDSVVTLDEHRWYFDDDEYEIYDRKIWGHDLKVLYLGPHGTVFAKHLPSGGLVKLNAINLSWVHEFLFERLIAHVEHPVGGRAQGHAALDPGSEASRRTPMFDADPESLTTDVRILPPEELEAGTHG